MNFKNILRIISSNAKRHSPELLTGAAVVGVIVSIRCAARAAIVVDEALDTAKEDIEAEPDKEDEIKKDTAIVIVKECAKPVVSGAITIFCIISSNRISASRQVALASMCTASQSALLEYKTATKKVAGKKKAEDIDYEAYNEKIDDSAILNTGFGNDLCCEAITGQVFYSDINRVMSDWLALEETMLEGEDICVNDWLYDLKIEPSSVGDNLLWRIDKEKDRGVVHMNKKCIFTRSGKPCIYLEPDRPPDKYA